MKRRRVIARHVRGRRRRADHLGVVAVAGAAAFATIAVDRLLQFFRRAQPLLLALVRVQVLHVSASRMSL